jgi:hypothetical protein
MLPESDDILWCLGRAKACAEAAATARTEPERTDFLKLERNWLVLALSYSIGAQVRETAMDSGSSQRRDNTLPHLAVEAHKSAR